MRLIPARAGNTVGGFDLVGASSAHPRSRGEHQCLIRNWRPRFGSSPLARGTHLERPMGWHWRRLIPARAGNTHHACVVLGARTAHPRSRGEHHLDGPHLHHGGGSSPLARGTRLGAAESRLSARLIPARAGNTPMNHKTLVEISAHPRSRGEHQDRPCFYAPFAGSSPLARGTRSPAAPLHRTARLIPARAGNTVED